jgi:hypothetical protein
VIEHEHLVAEHRQAIEILGTLLVRDGRHRCLQVRHVRFERDGHPIPKRALDARADRAQHPGGGCRHSKAHRGGLHETGAMLEHPFAEQHQPQGEKRVRQRGQLREHQRRHHQPGLVPVPQPAQPPHG